MTDTRNLEPQGSGASLLKGVLEIFFDERTCLIAHVEQQLVYSTLITIGNVIYSYTSGIIIAGTSSDYMDFRVLNRLQLHFRSASLDGCKI